MVTLTTVEVQLMSALSIATANNRLVPTVAALVMALNGSVSSEPISSPS